MLQMDELDSNSGLNHLAFELGMAGHLKSGNVRKFGNSCQGFSELF